MSQSAQSWPAVFSHLLKSRCGRAEWHLTPSPVIMSLVANVSQNCDFPVILTSDLDPVSPHPKTACLLTWVSCLRPISTSEEVPRQSHLWRVKPLRGGTLEQRKGRKKSTKCHDWCIDAGMSLRRTGRVVSSGAGVGGCSWGFGKKCSHLDTKTWGRISLELINTFAS